MFLFFGLKTLDFDDFENLTMGEIPLMPDNLIFSDKYSHDIKDFLENFKDDEDIPGKPICVLHMTSFGSANLINSIIQKYNIDFRVRDKNGYSLSFASMYAANMVNVDHAVSISKLLMKYGVRPDEKSPQGQSLLDCLLSSPPHHTNWKIFDKKVSIVLKEIFLVNNVLPSKKCYEDNKDLCKLALKELGGSRSLERLKKGNYEYLTFKQIVNNIHMTFNPDGIIKI